MSYASVFQRKMANAGFDELKTLFSEYAILVAAVGIAILVVLIILVCLVIVFRKKRAGAVETKRKPVRIKKPAAGDIPLGIEVLEGQYGGDMSFYLREELWMGRDASQCDIVFSDEAVSPCHTRIYRENGNVFIEDLHSENGTYLGGMRLYAPNRLRSGDEVGIGNTEFVVRF